jgi:hypothetical protein
VSQCALQIDAVTRVDAALAVQRDVVRVLGHHDVRQQAGRIGGTPSPDGAASYFTL